MPWCPNCKTEYREGITHCADCKAELVADLNSRTEKLKNATAIVAKIDREHKDFIQKCADFFEYSGVSANIVQEDDGMVAVYTTPEELKNAKRLFQAFYSVESERLQKAAEEAFLAGNDVEDAYFGDDEEDDTDTEAKPTQKSVASATQSKNSSEKTYGNAVSRYDDYRSSGSTFTVLGCLGIIFGVLSLTGVIPLFNSTFSSTVLLIVFGIFLILGVFSYVKAGKLKAAAVEEKEIIEKANLWLESNVTEEILGKVDTVTKNLIAEESENDDDEMVGRTDELLYLNRIDFLREFLMKEFPDLTPSFAEQLVEEFYNKKFEE